MYFSKERRYLKILTLEIFGCIWKSLQQLKSFLNKDRDKTDCWQKSVPNSDPFKKNYYEIDYFNRQTSGIFFSSANAIETSAWDIINSMAPEPKSYLYESVKANDIWIFKIRKLNLKVIQRHVFSVKCKNNLTKFL